MFSISKHGLCWQFDRLDSAFRHTITLDDFKKSLSKFITDTTLTSAKEIVNREIDFNYRQVIYYLRQECFEFEVYIILRNDTVAIGKVQELDYFHDSKVIKSSFFKLQPQIVDTYLENYFSHYRTKVSRQKFINQMTKLEIYGFACGWGRNYYPKQAKMTKKYVDTKNYKQLSKMLRSPIPEIKTYGARGLVQLERNGFKLSDADKIILDHYKKVNFAVYSCYGCLNGVESFLNILERDYE